MWIKKGEEDRSLIETQSVKYPMGIAEEAIIDRQNFTLTTESGLTSRLALSNNSPKGKVKVLEKWENPYWKSANRFYYPSTTNPIGQYLIVLGSSKMGEKFHQSIHQWPTAQFREDPFKQGPISNSGCIRIDPSNIQKVFEDIKIGSSIIFK